MAKDKISQYSTTNALNTDIGGIDIDENCLPSNLNNGIREVMSQLKEFQDGSSGDSLTITGNATLNGTTIPASKTLVDTDSAQTLTNKNLTSPTITGTGTAAFGNLSYTGTLTGGTGVINIGSGQVYKDASGNVGIGVVPSDWRTSDRKNIQVSGGSISAGETFLVLSANTFLNTSAVNKYLYNGTALSYSQSAAGHIWSTAVSGTAGDTISFSERLRVTSSGNVGIGTSSPGFKLQVADISATSTAQFGNLIAQFSSNASNADCSIQLSNGVDNSARMGIIGGSNIYFSQNGAERARIDSSGNLLLGTTALINSNRRLQVKAVSGGAASAFQVGNNGEAGCEFYNAVGAPVGSVTVNVSSTSYNTSSDYRLKEDAQPVLNPIDRLMQLNPINFAWKADGSRTDGFLAHEAQAVVPEAVTGTKDAVDKDGKPVHQGIDQSKLVPLLTAALQDAIKRIEQLESQINSGA